MHHKFLSPSHCKKFLLVPLIPLALGGCSLFNKRHETVQQGNIIKAAKVDQLKVGMTRNQVEKIMGSPLTENLFRPDEFQYVYYFLPKRGAAKHNKVIIVFEENRVQSIKTI